MGGVLVRMRMKALDILYMFVVSRLPFFVFRFPPDEIPIFASSPLPLVPSLTRWFKWSIDEFHGIWNPRNCGTYVMRLIDGSYKLTAPIKVHDERRRQTESGGQEEEICWRERKREREIEKERGSIQVGRGRPIQTHLHRQRHREMG